MGSIHCNEWVRLSGRDVGLGRFSFAIRTCEGATVDTASLSEPTRAPRQRLISCCHFIYNEQETTIYIHDTCPSFLRLHKGNTECIAGVATRTDSRPSKVRIKSSPRTFFQTPAVYERSGTDHGAQVATLTFEELLSTVPGGVLPLRRK